MLMLSALRKLSVFLINHDGYVPTAAKVYNCHDAVITALELEFGLSPVKSTAILFFIVMMMTYEQLSEKHSGLYLPDIYQMFINLKQNMISLKQHLEFFMSKVETL